MTSVEAGDPFVSTGDLPDAHRAQAELEAAFATCAPVRNGAVADSIATVSPGKGGLGTYSPPVDEQGSSVGGPLLTHRLAEALGLNLFTSNPVPLRRG